MPWRGELSTKRLQNIQDFFVALEGRDYVGTGHFCPRPSEHFAGALKPFVARGCACASCFSMSFKRR